MAIHQAYWSVTLLALLLSVSLSNSQQVIVLGDDTPKDDVVAENVLGDAMSIASGSSDGTVTYALRKSPVSSYFRVDEHTGRLMTRQPIDRDRLCVDSGLCCAQNTQNSHLSTVRPSDNGEMGTVCALRLDVAVTAGHKRDTVPTTRQVSIEIKDENDHPPVFVVSTFSNFAFNVSFVIECS